MAEIGQDEAALVPRAGFFAVAALVVAGCGALYLWPFTIDDALISVRYARHLAAGVGYRFDVHGAVTDGVTPLPWPFVLLPLSQGTAWAVLTRAKTLGLLAWLVTATGWGAAVGRAAAPTRAKVAALAGLGVSLPLAAHAVSGMETSLATAFATSAALLARRPWAAACAAGVAASLRPELLPWALVLSSSFAWIGGKGRAAPWGCAAVAVAPFAACVAARLAVFGSPAPLALAAKPSDLTHGAVYVAAAALVSVGPGMALAPIAASRERGPGCWIAVAGAVHLAAVAVAGGDWMPYARLVAPVVPSLLYAAVLLSSRSRPAVAVARSFAAVALGAWVFVTAAPAGRRVGPDREALARGVAPLLADRRRIASADVGWVSAATEADILDLSGVTDPDIAALGGGHTSKRVDGAMLLSRNPDALVLFAEAPVDGSLARWRDASFARVIDARLAADDQVGAHFAAAAFVPLGATGTGYFVLLRRGSAGGDCPAFSAW